MNRQRRNDRKASRALGALASGPVQKGVKAWDEMREHGSLYANRLQAQPYLIGSNPKTRFSARARSSCPIGAYMSASRKASKASGSGKRGPRGWLHFADDAESGFVAVDALVALAILSTTVALSIRTADTAWRTSDLAVETRNAQAVLEQALEYPAASPGSVSGRSGAFDWKVVISPMPLPAGASQADRLCQHFVEVRAGDSRRTFHASTVKACPPQEGPR